MSDALARLEKLEDRVADLESTVKAIEDMVVTNAVVTKPDFDLNKLRVSDGSVTDDKTYGLTESYQSLLEITEDASKVEIRANAWLGDDVWKTVNQTLREQGFTWISQGKQSHWLRRK